ncbi:MAG: hypothetical protein WBV94_07370 [Blastocatellia bacterium]
MSSSRTEQIGFETFEQEVLSPLHGHKLTPVEQYIASLLLHATMKKPLTNDDLRTRVMMKFDMKRPNPRTIKTIIRSLRKFHHFPILAHFQKPYGYWWCQSAKEMLAYYEDAQSRLKDELHTLSQLIKRNFPEYAGQLNLEDTCNE